MVKYLIVLDDTVSYMKIKTQTAEGLKTDLVKQSGQC